MNIEVLHYFKYIAKYKNITKAAQHFYISQSTLSRHIMALESELDVTLFDRSKKNLELTTAGKVFYKDCDALINHIDTTIKNVQAEERGYSGTIRIALPNHLTPILQSSLAQLLRSNPSIVPIIESYDFDEIPSAINHNLYHVGITYDFAYPENDDLLMIQLSTDDFSLVVSSELFPEITRDTISQIVKTLPIFLPSYAEPPCLKLILFQLQKFAEVASISIHHVNTTESVMLNTSLGLGYSIVPTSLVKSRNYDLGVSYITSEELAKAGMNAFSTKCSVVMLYKKEDHSKLLSTFLKAFTNTDS